MRFEKNLQATNYLQPHYLEIITVNIFVYFLPVFFLYLDPDIHTHTLQNGITLNIFCTLLFSLNHILWTCFTVNKHSYNKTAVQIELRLDLNGTVGLLFSFFFKIFY